MDGFWKAAVAYSFLWNWPISSVPLFLPPAKMPEKLFHLYHQPTEPPARTRLRRRPPPRGSWVSSLPLFPSSPLFSHKGNASLNVAQHVCVSLRWPASRHKMLRPEPQEEKKNTTSVLTRSDGAVSRELVPWPLPEHLWHMFAQWQHMQSQWSAVYEVRAAMEMQHHPSVACAHWVWC